jgi:hypothetical protein
MAMATGTAANPWLLKTPPLTSAFKMDPLSPSCSMLNAIYPRRTLACRL